MKSNQFSIEFLIAVVAFGLIDLMIFWQPFQHSQFTANKLTKFVINFNEAQLSCFLQPLSLAVSPLKSVLECEIWYINCVAWEFIIADVMFILSAKCKHSSMCLWISKHKPIDKLIKWLNSQKTRMDDRMWKQFFECWNIA